MYSQQSQKFPVRIQNRKPTSHRGNVPQSLRSRKRRNNRGLTKAVTALVLAILMISAVILTVNIFDRNTDTGTKSDISVPANSITDASVLKFRPRYQSRKTVYSSGNALFGKYENALCVNIIIHGEESLKVFSTDDTVGELLDSIGLTFAEDDELNCERSEGITDNMKIRIDSVKTVTRTEEETVPADSKTVENDDLAEGTERVKQEKRDGKKTVTYSDRYVNGELESTEAVSEEITLKPIDGITEIGTAKKQKKKKESSNVPNNNGTGGTFTDSKGNTYSYSKYIDVEATAYGDKDGTALTATGATVHYGIVAVDPKVIPYGTRMYVTGSYGDMGVMVAADCGNFKGNTIDIYLGTDVDVIKQFGRRQMRVYILN